MKRYARRVALAGLCLLSLLIMALPISIWHSHQAKAQIVGPYAPALCNSIGTFTGTAATVLVQAGAAGKVIYICGYQFTATAATTAALVYGTGGTCGTGQVAITGALNVNTTPTTDHQQYAYFSVPQIQPFLTATQNSICVTIGAAAVTGHIFFGQY